MERTPTIAELLAVRDGDPIDVAAANLIRNDVDARELLDELRLLRAELRALPNRDAPDTLSWTQIEQAARAKSRTNRQPWYRPWPLGLVASTVLLAGIFVLRTEAPDPALDATRTNISALQDRSRMLETALMRTSSYAGTTSEQALMFRLADVDTQLADLEAGGTLSAMQQRELLWQRRIELMEALQAVQEPAQTTLQYAVY